MYYLYLGAPVGGRIDEAYERVAMEECSRVFESFCVVRATGVFRGRREEVLVFHVATSDGGKVTRLAAVLRARFGQEGVGVVYPKDQGGWYRRIVGSG
jgi:hypothetical protein